MKLPDSQIKRILLAGGIVFLLIKFRGLLMPKKPLDADGNENNTINRAVDKIRNGSVEVASTPSEVTNTV